MKSAVVLAALIGFALINTAFLGVYLLSASSEAGLSSSGGSQNAVTATETSTAASTATSSLAVPNASTTANYTAGVSSLQTGLTNTFGSSAGSVSPRASFTPGTFAQFFEVHSLTLAPTSWFLVGGMWIWRGRMKSKWTDLGFDSDVFGLFVRMKGAKTRIRLLDALSKPKDRLQLAQELGLDWKAVDRHIEILDKYGFVHETVAYGKVRMYALTSTGKLLLQLLDELNGQEFDVPPQAVPPGIPIGAGAGT